MRDGVAGGPESGGTALFKRVGHVSSVAAAADSEHKSSKPNVFDRWYGLNPTSHGGQKWSLEVVRLFVCNDGKHLKKKKYRKRNAQKYKAQ